jgi:hypothetical protein
MANERRVRENQRHGVITDNPLSAAATSVNSAEFATELPAIGATEHCILVLDPAGVNGDPEILTVISHTAATTTATVTRGDEGSVARDHPQGTKWILAPTTYDYIGQFTSSTRPTVDIFEGQTIHETDTNKLYVFNGTDWAPYGAGGQLGYEQVIANQTGISAETDLTGLSVIVTVATGRRIKISSLTWVRQNISAALVTVRIKEGATSLARSQITLATNDQTPLSPFIVLSPSAGSHTYKLTLATSANTVDLIAASGEPSLILVEDIGAA